MMVKKYFLDGRENKTNCKVDFTFRYYEMMHGIPLSLIKEAIKDKDKRDIINKVNTGWYKKINEKLSILKIAECFDFKLKGDMAVCKFHKDTDPSLKFYDETGTFYCFGCRQTGNIVKFIKLCREKEIELKGDKSRWLR
jgi:hypothetical protein